MAVEKASATLKLTGGEGQVRLRANQEWNWREDLKLGFLLWALDYKAQGQPFKSKKKKHNWYAKGREKMELMKHSIETLKSRKRIEGKDKNNRRGNSWETLTDIQALTEASQYSLWMSGSECTSWKAEQAEWIKKEGLSVPCLQETLSRCKTHRVKVQRWRAVCWTSWSSYINVKQAEFKGDDQR